MFFLLVDDEKNSLRDAEHMLRRLYPDVEIRCADNCRDALVIAEQIPSVAFLDIEMPEMTGIELAERIQKINPCTNIIFVTAYDSFAREAYSIHASGYLTKPVVASDILKEMENLRYPVELKEYEEVRGYAAETQMQASQPEIRFQCFGSFEVFCGDAPLHFQRRGAKEILAYLIHLRGASAGRLEISSMMWESAEEIDRKRNYFRILIASLKDTLKKYGAEDILICRRDSYSVNTAKIDCDYYHFLNGDRMPQNQYRGEYMVQYSWAEDMNAQLYDMNYYRNTDGDKI